jgi:hypothetical protein
MRARVAASGILEADAVAPCVERGDDVAGDAVVRDTGAERVESGVGVRGEFTATFFRQPTPAIHMDARTKPARNCDFICKPPIVTAATKTEYKGMHGKDIPLGLYFYGNLETCCIQDRRDFFLRDVAVTLER